MELRALPNDPEVVKEARDLTGDKEKAWQFLRGWAQKEENVEEGPVRLVDVTDLSNETIWRSAASHYLTAFQKEVRTLPYFSGAV